MEELPFLTLWVDIFSTRIWWHPIQEFKMYAEN